MRAVIGDGLRWICCLMATIEIEYMSDDRNSSLCEGTQLILQLNMLIVEIPRSMMKGTLISWCSCNVWWANRYITNRILTKDDEI